MSQESVFDDKLREEAATTVTHLITKSLKATYEWAKHRIDWEKASASYVERWLYRWGHIHPLGADHPIPLQQIYVQVRAVPRSFVQRFASVEDLEASFRKSSARELFGLSAEEQTHYAVQSGIRIANWYSRLNILGSPGAGKSTFLRRLGLEALLPRKPDKSEAARPHYESEYEWEVLPVLIELRSLRNTPCNKSDDIMALLGAELENSGFPQARELVVDALNDGRFLVLLDGVDEIPGDELESAVHAIRDFISRFPKCRYVISCRTAFYKDWFGDFHDFVLADFDDQQIREFAKNWFTRDEERAANVPRAFAKLLASPEHRATRELAGSPLLLTFLCLVYRKTQQFPANRAQVYHKALRIFLEEWNAHKLIHNERLYKDLTPELEIELLKDIAGPSFLDSQLFFSGKDLTVYIDKFLRAELNAPRSLSATEILTAIAVQQGLFIERAQNVWTFSHLTIQEYLAAAWILEEGQANEVILKHAGDGHWREVLLLMCGLTRADGILAVLSDAINAMLPDDPGLAMLCSVLNDAAKLAWRAAEHDDKAANLIKHGPVCGQALLRTVALFLGRAVLLYPKGRFYVDHACELLLALDAALSLGYEQQIRNALHRSRGAVTTATDLNLTLDLDLAVYFNEASVTNIASAITAVDETANDSLVRHISLCKVMCDCKRAALRISLKGWELACSQMLSIRDRREVG